MRRGRGAVHQPLVAAHHLALNRQRLDRRDAAQRLDHEARTPVVGVRAVGERPVQRPADRDRQHAEARERGQRHPHELARDQPDQHGEHRRERQVDGDVGPLVRVELAQTVDRGQALQLLAGGFRTQRGLFGVEQPLDDAHGGLVFVARPRPRCEPAARRAQQALPDQNGEQQRE